MLRKEQVMANIESLLALNTLLANKAIEKTKLIQTKDADLEEYVNENLNTKKIASITDIKDENYAKKIYNEVRIVNKRVNENRIAINELIRKNKGVLEDV